MTHSWYINISFFPGIQLLPSQFGLNIVSWKRYKQIKDYHDYSQMKEWGKLLSRQRNASYRMKGWKAIQGWGVGRKKGKIQDEWQEMLIPNKAAWLTRSTTWLIETQQASALCDVTPLDTREWVAVLSPLSQGSCVHSSSLSPWVREHNSF